MKFSFEGRNYRLEFERKHRNVEILRNGKHRTIKSTYPYTTVTLFEVRPPLAPRVVAHATVGCMHSDSYSNAAGRLYAMRSLTAMLKLHEQPKELRTAMWEAYINRGREQKKQTAEPVIETTATRVPLALPPAEPTVADLNNLDGRTIH